MLDDCVYTCLLVQVTTDRYKSIGADQRGLPVLVGSTQTKSDRVQQLDEIETLTI